MKKLIFKRSIIVCLIALLPVITASKAFSQAAVISKTDVTCYGADDGTATVSVSGGSPPYSYEWSTENKDTTAAVGGLSGGSYSVIVTDANYCVVVASTTIEEPPPINISISGGNANIPFCRNETPPSVTLTASASGGESNFSYNWPGGSITVNSPGNHTVTVTDGSGCSQTASAYVAFQEVLCAYDPNDITGPEGYDTLHWIPKNIVMPYTIRFENDPDFATAPAQRVAINQKVDPNMNIFSFRLSDFGFGDFSFKVPPNSTFYTERLDVIDSLGVFVDVIAGIDIIENEFFWIFESIDPQTGYSPVDASIGFLPVNDSIRQLGEGFVTYTVMPSADVTTGDTIAAQASIVFDVEEPIETNIWVNKIDAIAPTSYIVDNYPTYSDINTIPIILGGSDDPGGTGIKSFELFYSKNNEAFTLYQEYDVDSLVYFTATSGYYKFYSIAIDHVGNKEEPKSTHDADITIISNLKYAVHGSVNYGNFNSSPLDNSTVYIKSPGGDIIDSTGTDQNGNFMLEDVSTGVFVIDASTIKPWGGVNATDALIINRAAIQMVTLDSLQKIVADVNASGTITATDALLTLRRSIGLDDAFAAGDWYFTKDTISVFGDTLFDKQIIGLCIGDVNRSYQPTTARLFRSTTPEYSGVVEVFEQIFDYPIYIQNDMLAGAITLTIDYPEDQVSIEDVSFKGKDLLYNDQGGILRIGWNDINGESFDAEELLISIRMKHKPILMESPVIQPTLNEPSEIADVNANILFGSRLRFPEIQFKKREYDLNISISNYPNPCVSYTTFSYNLPESGNAEIKLFNALGELVRTINLGEQIAGENSYTMQVEELAAGVYQYKLMFKGDTEDAHISGRLVIGSK